MSSLSKKIGGVEFTLDTAKRLKEADFKRCWAKFLTIDTHSAWVQIQKFVEENSKKKVKK